MAPDANPKAVDAPVMHQVAGKDDESNPPN